MIDKLLIILMIITLPAGIFAAYQVNSQNNSSLDEQQTQKIDTALKQIEQAIQKPQANTNPKISVNTTTYSSDTEQLVISGIAPQPDAQVIVSAVITPESSESESEKNQENDVLGHQVDVYAITPKPDGTFILKYPLKSEPQPQFVEITFQQHQSATTIKYDLKENKLLWKKN